MSFQNRIEETNVANCGMKMTIIAYRNCDDIDIQFEDKTIIPHKSYDSFKKGVIQNPNTYKNAIIGQKQMANCGMMMEVIDYNSANDITVKFEDGTVITNKNYNNFKQHSIKHPTLFATHRNNNIIKDTLCNIKITGLAYQTPDETNYFCECPVCSHKDIWNVAEIKEHSETCHTDQRKEITA